MEDAIVYIFVKGRHTLNAYELGTKWKVEGLRGWLDSLEVYNLLVGNGYKLIK